MNDMTPTPDPAPQPAETDETTEPKTTVDGVQPTTVEPPTEMATTGEFEAAAAAPEMGFFAEFWDFLVHNKAWWLTPIILVLALVFVLVWFAATPFAPFIYGA